MGFLQHPRDVEFHLAVGHGSFGSDRLCRDPRTGASQTQEPFEAVLGECGGTHAGLQETRPLAEDQRTAFDLGLKIVATFPHPPASKEQMYQSLAMSEGGST